MTSPDFRQLPDLASRELTGSVMYANDELFAQRENLIAPGPALHDLSAFGHKGKVYDGWETRRRREPGHDVAIVRLGVPGVIRGVVIDTAWFTGNFPPFASVDAVRLEGYPGVADLLDAPWEPVVDKVALRRNTRTLAQAYLEFLYTPEGQEIVARHYYRPRDAAVLEKYRAQFAQVELVDIAHFGGWRVVQKQHFATGGVFDQFTTGQTATPP
jgi:allantoicase